MGRYLVNSKQTQPCLISSSHVCMRNTNSWLEEKVASTQIPHQMAEYDLAVGTEHGTSGSSFCDNYDLDLPSAMIFFLNFISLKRNYFSAKYLLVPLGLVQYCVSVSSQIHMPGVPCI